MLTSGTCSIFEYDSSYFVVSDESGKLLLRTIFKGVAIYFRDAFNARGSDFDLETGEFEPPGEDAVK